MARIASVFDLFGTQKVKQLPERHKWGFGVEIINRGQKHRLLASFPRRGTRLGRVLVADHGGELLGGVVLNYAPISGSELRASFKDISENSMAEAAKVLGREEATDLCWVTDQAAAERFLGRQLNIRKSHFGFFAAQDGLIQQDVASLWEVVCQAEIYSRECKRRGINPKRLATLRRNDWDPIRQKLSKRELPELSLAYLLARPENLEPLTRAFWLRLSEEEVQAQAAEVKAGKAAQAEAEQRAKASEAADALANKLKPPENCPDDLEQYLSAIYAKRFPDATCKDSDRIVFQLKDGTEIPVKLPAGKPILSKKVILDPSLAEHHYDYLKMVEILNNFFNWCYYRGHGDVDKVGKGPIIEMGQVSECTVEIYVDKAGPKGQKENRIHFCFVVPEGHNYKKDIYTPQPVEFVSEIAGWQEYFERRGNQVVPMRDIETRISKLRHWGQDAEKRAAILDAFRAFPKEVELSPEQKILYLLSNELAAKAKLKTS